MILLHEEPEKEATRRIAVTRLECVVIAAALRLSAIDLRTQDAAVADRMEELAERFEQ